MKILKTLCVMAMSVATLSVAAAIDTKATISVKADNSKYGDEVKLYQDTEASQLVDDIAVSGDYAVNMYAKVNTAHYASVKQTSLDGLKIEFVANKKETAYTMSFSNVLGELILSGNDTSFVIDATKPYAFTCDEEEVIEFTIQTAVFEREAAAGAYGTLCLPHGVAAADVKGAKIWKVIGKEGNNIIASEVTTDLVAGNPYIFEVKAGESKISIMKYKNDTESEGELVTNMQGSVAGCDVPEGAYILQNGMFRLCGTGCKIAANRAYLTSIEFAPAAPARAGERRIVIGVEQAQNPTELDAIEAAKADGKMLINGQLIIIKDGVRYNVVGGKL